MTWHIGAGTARALAKASAVLVLTAFGACALAQAPEHRRAQLAPGRPAPEQPSAPAPADPGATAAPSSDPAAAEPAEPGAPALAPYDGPMRYRPWLSSGGAKAQPSAPLETEMNSAQLIPFFMEDQTRASLFDTVPRARMLDVRPKRSASPETRALAQTLKAEADALGRSGFSALQCLYHAPGSDNATNVYFWYQKRGPLSGTMLSAGRLDAVDIALARCPATLGDAVAIASGRMQAPSVATINHDVDRQKSRTDVRFLAWPAKRSNYDDTVRYLRGAELLPAMRLAERMPLVDGERTWERKPSPHSWLGELTKLSDAGQKVLYCDYVQNVDQNGATQRYTTGVAFWHQERPALSTEALAWLGETGFPLIDKVASGCPQYFGELIALANGTPEALATAQRAGAAANEAKKTLCERIADRGGASDAREPSAAQICTLVRRQVRLAVDAVSSSGQFKNAPPGLGVFSGQLLMVLESMQGKLDADLTRFEKLGCEPLPAGDGTTCRYVVDVSTRFTGGEFQKRGLLNGPIATGGETQAVFRREGSAWYMEARTLGGGGNRQPGGSDYFDQQMARQAADLRRYRAADNFRIENDRAWAAQSRRDQIGNDTRYKIY